MPDLKQYHLFISHGWEYSDDYISLVDLLNMAPYFTWRSYSDPKRDPIVDPKTPVGKREMIAKLENQISPTHCVLIVSGMYVAYSEWIQHEIDISRRLNKPIIGIRPRGQERIPQQVQDAAKEMVGWNTDSIVNAIRKWSL